MNGRYVDDNSIFPRSIGRTMKFCPTTGCLVEKSEDEVKECENMTEDKITMEELRKVADTHIGMLTTEADSTSKHPELGNKLPILDMAVWVEEVSLHAPGLEDKHAELHSKCEKSEECLPLRPAEASGDQSRLEGREEAACRLVPQVRKEVLQAGLTGYSKILEADAAGTKPMYRTQEWRKSAQGMEDQKLRKGKGKRWLGGDYKSCIFVPPTPGSELVKLMQQKEKVMRPGGRENYAIKIIESAGNPIERMLVNVDPFNGNKCEDKKCVLSMNSSNKINGRKKQYRLPDGVQNLPEGWNIKSSYIFW